MLLIPAVFIIFNLFQVFFFSAPLVFALLILLQVNKRILALSVLASFSVFTIVISFLGRKEEREIGIEEENRNHYP